jgi:lipopolysaccharide/colanic/teichoic acid biosynthesis glycosyltransferase
MIKLDSKGPVIYSGIRIGLNGNEFFMYKFRTMVVGAESDGTTTYLNDRRITRIGKLLRKFKIDELPQFLNVIKGDMSIVGPRPEVYEHTSAYSNEEKIILSVTPGITDYSSIYFSSLTELLGETDAHEIFVTKFRARKNLLRIKYVEEQSFFIDAKIIFLTIVTILKKLKK